MGLIHPAIPRVEPRAATGGSVFSICPLTLSPLYPSPAAPLTLPHPPAHLSPAHDKWGVQKLLRCALAAGENSVATDTKLLGGVVLGTRSVYSKILLVPDTGMENLNQSQMRVPSHLRPAGSREVL